MTPTTGLLIPCYNAERYLPALKKQIDGLNPKFDEVILVDDGSTDRTVEKGRELGLAIEPLGVNRGPGAARNAAVKKCRAEWIHFLDADDEIAPNYLEKILPLAGPGVDVVLCACEDIDERTRKKLMQWNYPDELWQKEPIRGAIQRGVVTYASFIRKAKFDEIGGFNEERRCWEDGDMHLRLALAGARFRAVPDVLCTSLRHARGTSGNTRYCNRCRLEFLNGYSSELGKIDRADLLHEVMETAARMFKDGDSSGVKTALGLARELGWKGPKSNHLMVKIMGYLPFPRIQEWLFFKQQERRNQS